MLLKADPTDEHPKDLQRWMGAGRLYFGVLGAGLLMVLAAALPGHMLPPAAAAGRWSAPGCRW